MQWVVQWALAFLWTQLVEAGVYFPLIPRGRPAQRLILALSPSALTHLWVWFVCPVIIPTAFSLAQEPMRWIFTTAGAELFAVVVEGGFLWALAVPRPWRWSLLANAASFVTGLVAYEILGW